MRALTPLSGRRSPSRYPDELEPPGGFQAGWQVLQHMDIAEAISTRFGAL
ncbi:uncharacterized protein TRAVEDRAFT_54517 [Trametes versicolor FP-101664 SS1]|uniref:Uncharacterized protein n=1 Tax=Trametes versicolor (strain FP-101664) TaxID=717944 RepID=R7S6D1_TRAVS|nr:uncharacterized protein TRAVEDRAFT_54517 [Trametes versicolor FP-101664 SS1]EIW51478.1 hypothetical protein TRAVEDRAFT_54517 [Trametes versicolor FP-101664 SS1]